MYPYELNGRQLYQDHPAGQGFSARGYDVAKQIFFHTASYLPHPELSQAILTEGIKITQPWLATCHFSFLFCFLFLPGPTYCFTSLLIVEVSFCRWTLQLLFIDCMVRHQRLRLAACLGRWLFQNRLLLIMCRQTNTRIVRGPDTDEQLTL